MADEPKTKLDLKKIPKGYLIGGGVLAGVAVLYVLYKRGQATATSAAITPAPGAPAPSTGSGSAPTSQGVDVTGAIAQAVAQTQAADQAAFASGESQLQSQLSGQVASSLGPMEQQIQSLTQQEQGLASQFQGFGVTQAHTAYGGSPLAANVEESAMPAVVTNPVEANPFAGRSGAALPAGTPPPYVAPAVTSAAQQAVNSWVSSHPAGTPLPTTIQGFEGTAPANQPVPNLFAIGAAAQPQGGTPLFSAPPGQAPLTIKAPPGGVLGYGNANINQ